MVLGTLVCSDSEVIWENESYMQADDSVDKEYIAK